jgi:hypothetical protein
MKTTKFLFILLLPMLFAQGVKGQGYNPFPKENAFWTVIEYEQFNTGNYSSVRLYTINGDTIFSGISYYKIYKYYKHINTGDTLIELHSLMREDTVQKKVWFVRLYINETVEKLGYDFSVNVGDTVSLPALDFYIPSSVGGVYELAGDSLFMVTQIGIASNSQMLPNINTNSFQFTSLTNPFYADYYIEEGIGTVFFPFPSLFTKTTLLPSWLICLSIDTIFYGWFEEECGFFPYNIQEVNKLKAEVFPNPCSEQLNLRFQNPAHEKLSIEFISHTGKVVFSDNISNVESYSLNISNFASGLYLLRLTDKQQTQTFKIIVAP